MSTAGLNLVKVTLATPLIFIVPSTNEEISFDCYSDASSPLVEYVICDLCQQPRKIRSPGKARSLTALAQHRGKKTCINERRKLSTAKARAEAELEVEKAREMLEMWKQNNIPRMG